jgi:ubiquinol-cytochrome c reductase cytochrome b subunit
MRTLLAWLEDRSGIGACVRDWLQRPMAGGVAWRHVWPTTLAFTFLVQAMTGLVLWIYYSPSSQTAWESVYNIQCNVAWGWLVRGIHHYAGQVMLVLVGLYFLQMLIRGAYRAPRELLFWTVVLLALITVALNLTGDLLPWDQNSYWATHVRVGFLHMLPLGDRLFELAAGGPEFSHLTSTRFLTLHVGVFSVAFAGLLALHGWLARRHGMEPSLEWHAQPYWPRQALRDSIACLAVLFVVLVLAFWHCTGDATQWGAGLGAPANPAEGFQAARPEWSFRGLFQFRSLLPPKAEILAIFVIPGCLVLLVFAMPWIGKSQAGHIANIGFILFVLVGLACLSYRSYKNDANDEGYQKALVDGNRQAQRVIELASSPQQIPREGALAILPRDPKTQGPVLFHKQCASCHDYADGQDTIARKEPPKAPDLYRFASREWLKGFLDPKGIASPEYFGNTKFKSGKMARFLKENWENFEPKDVEAACAALSAEAGLPAQREMDREDAAQISEGRKGIAKDMGCGDCHKFREKTSGASETPSLTGYGSREWLIGIINDAGHRRFYGKANDGMPVYADSSTEPANHVMSARDIGVLADWLRGDWYEVEEE